MLGRWRKRGEKHRADEQQADPAALEVEGDPRGGVKSEDTGTPIRASSSRTKAWS
jgi:hypothetical protein